MEHDYILLLVCFGVDFRAYSLEYGGGGKITGIFHIH